MLLRISLILTVLFYACVPTVCQEKEAGCAERALRGFKLGMSVDEVKARIDMWSISFINPPDETGFFEAGLIKSQLLNKADRENLSSIRLGFLDDHLVTIEVRYGTEVKWSTTREFAEAVSGGLDLPSNWTKQTIPDLKIDALTLRCGEAAFAIIGSVFPQYLGPTLIMYRPDTKPIRDARRSEIQEMRRRTFKP